MSCMHTVSAIIGHGSETRIPNTADLKRRAEQVLAVSDLSGITVLEPKREVVTACSTSVEISFV